MTFDEAVSVLQKFAESDHVVAPAARAVLADLDRLRDMERALHEGRAPLKLAQLIEKLAVCDPALEVYLDDGRAVRGLVSWRGVYAQLSLDSDVDDAVKAGPLLKACQDAVGKTFTGWKGGDFVMHAQTEVWADAAGDYQGRATFDVTTTGGKVIIRTVLLRD